MSDTFKTDLLIAIPIIRNLVDLYFESKGLVLADFIGEDIRIINALRPVYIGMSLWLEYYLLNEVSLDAELTFTNKVYLKPLAERAKSVYNLATELYLREEWAKQYTPAFWMLNCEIESFDSAIKSAFAQGGNSQNDGKYSCYEKVVQRTAQIEKWASRPQFKIVASHPSELEGKVRLVCGVRNVLESGAAAVAAKDKTFQPYLTHYLKEQRRLARQIRDCPSLKVVALREGRWEELGRGKRGRGKRGGGKDKL